MKVILKKSAVSLLAAVFLFACSEKYQGDYEYLNSDIETLVTFDEEAIVSLELATDVAKAFFGREAKSGAKSFASASVETVTDKNNNPSMYIINYPEGGWVIVGATRNYYPVLAYNDEGSFVIKPETEMGGAFLWLEETKEATRVSPSFADTTKAQMHHLWQAYEANSKKIPLGAKNQQMMDDRINQLYIQNSSNGWMQYMSLDDAIWYFDPYVYQNLVDFANVLGSPTEYAIVGIKTSNTYSTKGPLLSTIWHQDYPFNYFCPGIGNPNNDAAGCLAVAMAQIIKKHQKPNNLSWNGVSINLTDLPDSGNTVNPTSNSTSYLIRRIGADVNTRYGFISSSAQIDSARIVLQSYGYTATRTAHNATDVKNAILNNRPVIMYGERFDELTKKNIGHAWVCDGHQTLQTSTFFFIEFLVSYGYYNPGTYTPANPGTIYTGSLINYFYHKWGEINGKYNGWYLGDSVYQQGAGGYNYQDNRQHNIYAY